MPGKKIFIALAVLAVGAALPAFADGLTVDLGGLTGDYVAAMGASARSVTVTLDPNLGSIGDLSIHWMGVSQPGVETDDQGVEHLWYADLIAFLHDPHGNSLWATTISPDGVFDTTPPFTLVDGAPVTSYSFLLDGPIQIDVALVSSEDEGMTIVSRPTAHIQDASLAIGVFTPEESTSWGQVKSMFR